MCVRGVTSERARKVQAHTEGGKAKRGLRGSDLVRPSTFRPSLSSQDQCVDAISRLILSSLRPNEPEHAVATTYDQSASCIPSSLPTTTKPCYRASTQPTNIANMQATRRLLQHRQPLIKFVGRRHQIPQSMCIRYTTRQTSRD